VRNVKLKEQPAMVIRMISLVATAETAVKKLASWEAA